MRDTARVRDLMSREVRTVERNDTLAAADEIMSRERIRHLVVLEDDGTGIVGVLSRRDVFRSALSRALGYGARAQERLMDQLRVKDVMTNSPITIGPDEPIRSAAQRLVAEKIGCLPVVEGERLVGILTEGDFVAAFARGASIS
jgi:CBS domain-containing membrane protein